ncbi:MAG: pyrroloquinoline quinone biosynthesis peptide chaperone PqqD [Candidatus Rokuibacteriota bacterium]|nr:MAG: pyrroloquinoline quinone biosynthesis peptide chaperone PqqD [Candidatus Rokubacteria bacterium]
MISVDMRPRLAGKARLRFDRKGERYMLLYPEKGLVLNDTATAIVKLCTGEHTVQSIIDTLAAAYGAQPREAIEREVLSFLGAMADRALVEPA